MTRIISARQAAREDGVLYKTLYNALRKDMAAFGAFQKEVETRPLPIWMLDTESAGYQHWLSRHRQGQGRRGPRITPTTPRQRHNQAYWQRRQERLRHTPPAVVQNSTSHEFLNSAENSLKTS